MRNPKNVLAGLVLAALALCLWAGCAQKQKDYRQVATSDIKDSELDKAIAFYEQYGLTHPKDLKAHNNLGILYRRSGNLNRARVQYEYVLLMDSTDAEAHNNLGIWYGILNQVDSAIGEFNLAVKYQPDFPKAHRNLASMYQRSDRDSLALAEMEAYLKLAPDASDTGQVRQAMEQIREKMKKKR
jgi:tetratricopeptide (TPR) repeat protein